ncbi:MAG: penicillin-binding protein 2 [Methyloceanibacter sp.]|uniref:penicillin-binding protein 2 n=1 Tax=Methyloceanibacter sp. TaxID=1965321 RepID=UPI003D6C9D4F
MKLYGKTLLYGTKAPDYARKQRHRFSRRALLLGAGQAGLFGLLGWRLHQLQILDSSDYRLLSDENRMTVQLVAPARGVIYDRFGTIIAEDLENLRVLVLPAFCKNLSGTLDALATIVPVSAATRDRVMRAARRQSGYYPVLVSEGLSWRQFALLNVLAPQIPGVRTDRSAQRRYSHARSMAHMVGYVGMAGKDEVDEAPVMRLPGFRAGRAGIEKTFDADLRGSPGAIKYEVDAHGRVVRELGSKPSTRGRDVVLTIDHHLQNVALDRIKEHRIASIVVLDVVTGGIVVMASTPTFDANDIAFNPDPEQWRALARAQDNPFENRAIRGVYPPGSTFKVATALAGLTHGVIDPEERMHCPGGYVFGRRTYRCWKRHGTVFLHEAIKQSCDVFFYETARRVGIDHLAVTCRELGLGQIYDCGLTDQKQGIVPDTAWKRKTLNEPWWPGETISCAIGQGFVATTPFQLAVMTARIATGRAVLPRLVMTANDTVEPWPKLNLDPVHLDLVRAGMIGVVNEKGGTGVRSALQIPDLQMAGKTGTSQVISTKNEHLLSAWERETHALFIAYAPAHAPRYAAACVVEHGGGGSRAAAPIVRDVMTEILLRDPAGRPAFMANNDLAAPSALAAAGPTR